MDQRNILLHRVIAFHLEAIPVGPHRRANAVGGEQIGDLIGFDRVVEGGDLVAEFLGHIDHLRHFIGPVAMVVDQDLAVEDTHKRIHRQVAFGHVAAGAVIFVPLALILRGLDPHFAGVSDIAHARLRHIALRAIDPFGIFAAGHLEPVRRAREFHPLGRPRRDVLEHDRAPAEQVGRSGQDLKRGDPAIDQRARKAGVLRPHAMFGPHLGPRRRGRFIAVAERFHPGRGIIAQMAVDIDDPRSHIFACPVDLDRPGGGGKIGAADSLHYPVAEHDCAVVDPLAVTIEHGGVADDGQRAGIAHIGRRVRVLVDMHRRREPGLGRKRGAARQKTCNRDRRDCCAPDHFTPCIRYLSGHDSSSNTTPMIIANVPIFSNTPT